MLTVETNIGSLNGAALDGLKNVKCEETLSQYAVSKATGIPGVLYSSVSVYTVVDYYVHIHIYPNTY